ncbi:MAG: DOMON-like domain-containing protein [Psychrobacter sp.]
MSQSFDLYLATETLAEDAQQLDVTVKVLQQISVQVSATLVAQPKAYLQLQYHVTLPSESLAALLAWPKWHADKVGFKDYLWEQTCLECFLAGSLVSSRSEDSDKSLKTNMTMPYIEINASPEGQYALYQFDGYRSPTTLPPRPLIYADGQIRAAIDWIDGNNPKLLIDYPISTHEPYHYQRSFRMPLDSSTSLNRKSDYSNDALIKYIHPCVILSFGATILYFAPKHASPPDFHNRQYWTPFDRLAALAK